MKRTAVIHVGLEKTGSTAIQSWLHSARQELLQSGILVPQSIGAPNHTRLVAACLDDGVLDNIKAHYLSRQVWHEAEWRAQTRADFDAEVTGVPGWSKLVISSELISSRLHSLTEVARLCDWIGRHVDRLHFVVYIRRQDELAVSRFSTALRTGHAGFDGIWSDLSGNSFRVLPPGRNVTDEREFFNYQRIIDRFLAQGDVDLTVRTYDPPSPAFDVVADFRTLLGLEPGTVSGRTYIANPALSVAAQFVIAELNRDNRVSWPSGARNDPYRALLRRVEAELPGGPTRRVSKAEAEAFLARFQASNAAVEQRWFPNGMFRSGFSQWPDSVDYSDVIAEAAPALARYRAEAARLPKLEKPRSVGSRLLSVLLKRRGE
jgi:hypothetical protein